MGKVSKEKILEILEGYDKDNITIATLGSHTSLHILNGAKQEGFRTAIVCAKGREVPYQRFDVADEYIIVDKFEDIPGFCHGPRLKVCLARGNAKSPPTL